MLNKLSRSIRNDNMISPGEEIICAVSGGADSIALLFAMKLLTDVMDFKLSAAHFNHHLRGTESDRDEAFVKDFCAGYGIPLYLSGGQITPGKKGLEASARQARYDFLLSLPGKIATAHTADDNAETILMHLIRGTGLKGLGGITPKTDRLIRPMLSVTRDEVERFLEEYALPHVEDSSNESSDFLRNRIRHSVMPLMRAENPRFSENLSAMARNLRMDEDFLTPPSGPMPGAAELRRMHGAPRRRYLERFLKENGVKEPENAHLEAMEALVFSGNPSAKSHFPGGILIGREYDRLVCLPPQTPFTEVSLPCPGKTVLASCGVCIEVFPAEAFSDSRDCFTVEAHGKILVRPRRSGDEITLSGGTKKLKKLFIDRKIPAARRPFIPVIADDDGILGVYGIGANRKRIAQGKKALCIRFTDLTETNGIESSVPEKIEYCSEESL